MPTNNTNTVSREDFLKKIGHPRKKQLATMILDGASVAELNEAGFGRLNILEAARDIRLNVVGQEELRYDIPRGESMDSTTKADIEKTAEADAAEKKDSPEASKVDDESPASVTAQTVADAAPGDVISDNQSNSMSTEDENKGDATGSTEGQGDTVAPSGDPVPGVTADQSNVETLGGNDVGTLTGEEDAETLQRKADEEKAADQGDAA